MYYQDLTDYRVALAELESLVGLDLRTSGLSKSNADGNDEMKINGILVKGHRGSCGHYWAQFLHETRSYHSCGRRYRLLHLHNASVGAFQKARHLPSLRDGSGACL